MPTEAEVLSALSVIIDPDFQKDIVTLGFVKNIVIDLPTVAFDVELTTPACPIKERFRAQAEEAVLALPGVDTVHVNMTAQERKKNPLVENSHLGSVQSIIAISSCKGGVGKSTIAAGIAKSLAQRGHKVGLLDADIYGPSVPTLFNLQGEQLRATADNTIVPIDIDGLKVVSFGFLTGDEPAVMRGPMVSNYMQQLLHGVDWGELDYLFIDMPPGTGDVQLTISQSVQLDGAIIITTPQALSLVDVGKGILMFDKVDVPVLGVIENMAYFECDGCTKKHFIFGKDGTKKLTDHFGLDILAQLPLDPEEFAISYAAPLDSLTIADTADAVIMALGKNSIASAKPEVSFGPRSVMLKFKGGEELKVSNVDLRASCACAVCVNEMTGERILQRESIAQSIMPVELSTVGNYAIRINWNDGHNTGLFPYKRIRELAAATV